MRSNKQLISCGIAVIAALVIAIVLTFLFAIRIPDAGTQMQAMGAPIFVNITMPLNDSQVVVDQGVSVYVEAYAKLPIKEIELFVDGTPIHNRLGENPPDTVAGRVVWWGWVPTEEGLHQLVARARTDNGQAVFSNVVIIKAIPLVDMNPPEQPIPPENESLTEEEALALVDLEGLEKLAENSPGNSYPPSIEPEDPVPPNPPIDDDPIDPPGPGIISIEKILWGQKWIGKYIHLGLPAAPEIQGSIQECKARFKIRDNSDNEVGFFIYRLNPGTNLFTRIATLKEVASKSQVFSYTDANPPVGESTYYASSFNSTGEIQGNVIKLKVDNPPCAPAAQPTIVVKDAVLKTSLTVDKIYGYLSVDKETWFRFPTALDDFIYPVNNQFDMAKHLPGFDAAPPGIHVVDLEIWGWAGETLIDLGKATWEVSSGSHEIVGDKFSITAEVEIALQVSESDWQITPLNIPRPYSLRYFKNKEDCLQNRTKEDEKFFCGLMDGGYSVITWRWLPDEIDELTEIDGFKLYKGPWGIEPENPGYLPADARMTIVAPPSADPDESPPQIFLRAYKGKIESEDSNKLNGITGKSIVLKNYIEAWGEGLHLYRVFPYKWTEISFYRIVPLPVVSERLTSGSFRHTRDLSGYLWVKKYISIYFDSFVIFDLSPIKGSVLSAKLRWNKENIDTINYPETYWKCQVVITDGFQDTVVHGSPLNAGVEYDVTQMVRNWMMGLPNDEGFGFQTLDDSLSLKPSVGTEVCFYRLDDLSLEVITNDDYYLQD